jgi:hypothetical protein
MNKVLTFCLPTVLLAACGSESQNKTLTYQNIVILSDLSSRIDNRPEKDTTDIFKLADYFKNECVRPGEKIGDKSCITFSALSEKVAASVDLSQIKYLGDKQSFINSTGKFAHSGLDQKLKEFKSSVANVYSTVRNPGLDLISMLIEKINNEPIVKEDTHVTDGIDTTYINYQNHIYIFTDGYLEYKNKSANSQFYFGTPEIEKVRQYCVDNKVDTKTALETNKSLCLPAFSNDKNKLINLHILETDERDKDLKLETYKHPTGLRDNDILEAVWKKWAGDSGFKNFQWQKY